MLAPLILSLSTQPLHITTHAVERYQERVANVAEETARAALNSPAVRLAAQIGAPYVKLGTGQRIALKGHSVVTVLSSTHRPKSKRFHEVAE